MDFSWTSEQLELYDRALDFARANLSDDPKRTEGKFPRTLWQRCGEFGFLGLPVPERHGGLGLDTLTTARVMEALGRGCVDTGLVFSAGAHLFACVMPILEAGDDRQKTQYLPRLCSGEWVGANAISEPEAGSDVFALKTRAVRDGDSYVLDGGKSYVTNGPDADVFLVYAVTHPTSGYLGLSAFLIEKKTPGLSVGRPFEKMGLSTSPIAPIYLEGCRVPASAMLGAEGQGAPLFKRSMQWERACLFAAYVGVMERVLEQTVDFARQRKQFKRAIGKNQAISHRLADMKLRLESSRLLLYRACWLMDRGQEASMEVSLAKLAISEAAVQCGLDTLQIHGGMGYVTETGIERVLRDAIPSTIFSGTSEIQRDIIASNLGL
ncbi:acyl-CoA dehydrogenase family protein [Stigmatella aurantiaca]|uniref:Acyl-CoA dehydrogenase n=1 Tax=Stigmatella aurantiaca (strain DW4/3-1) TaxID=378806 RepID=B5X0H8_STIAD|nr:acyl-CoA dehydrogenase family protein [Stigmatella aurantiaca]ADO72619.1 Acyl-CoA dehydrogenase [Stigmatella aurantiaca DW4/3-1]CAQ34915.1 TPA: putative L-prolyl-S-PCP Dehydrogenase [Stigmatella aurantiaca DW4/3-1]